MYQRLHRLCYTCGERFDPCHAARYLKIVSQLNMLIIEDMAMILEENIMEQLHQEDQLAVELCQLFVNVDSGTDEKDSLHIQAML